MNLGSCGLAVQELGLRIVRIRTFQGPGVSGRGLSVQSSSGGKGCVCGA